MNDLAWGLFAGDAFFGAFVEFDGDGFEESIDDGVGSGILAGGGESGHDAVSEYGFGDGADIVGGDVESPLEEGVSASAEDEVLSGAWSCAPGDEFADEGGRFGFAGSSCADEVAGVDEDVFCAGDSSDDFLEGLDLTSGEHGREFGFFVAGGLFEDAEFFGGGGVADDDIEHEAVELCFWEWVGAFLFDGVLSGECEEGVGEIVGAGADGDVSFLHGFEECGLCFGWSAVDFVGEEDVCEEGSWDELEGAATGFRIILEHIGSGDIGGHEVGSELDAAEGELEDA